MAITGNHFEPDYCTPPGATLEETLEHVSMSKKELAARLGITAKTVSEIISGKAPISPHTAVALERVLDIPASFWLAGEGAYRQFVTKMEQQAQLAQAENWMGQFPWREMVKRGWVEACIDTVGRVEALLSFFGVNSPDEFDSLYGAEAVAYSLSQAFESDRFALATWLRQGERLASDVACSPYSKLLLKETLPRLRALTQQKEPRLFLPSVAKECARCGVAVVLVRTLKGTPVNGATWWLTPARAAVQLSARYLSDDILWFSLFHELGHILLHSKKERYLEYKGVSSTQEDEANRFAAGCLIPTSHFQQFVARGEFHERAVCGFARQIGIAPGVVVGRLQHDGELPRSHLNGLKVRYKWEQKANDSSTPP